ncbi:MAG: hypothetical protein K8R58_09570, partial [Bacteroidales bacterium]|nr:hypothetical protein [Bacteroidales bacterium]
MKKYFLIIFLFVITYINAQNVVNPDGYNIFYYENEKKSSEGFMKNGQPDGYWKTYNKNGILKSEGNRKNFELDSIWTFYNDSGKVILKINYLKGKKNGIRTTYHEDEIEEENFIDNVKQGLTIYYYSDRKIRKKVNFIDGLEEGIAKEFSKKGIVIKLIEYKKGFIINIENINKTDKSNLKQGKWIYFYENENIRKEGTYKNDLKHGYFKEYTEDGNLISTTKYVDGIKQEDVAELARLEIKTDYYPDGKVKIVASYKNDIPEGIRREYSQEGDIVKSYVFKNGDIVGDGIIDEEGIRDGHWEEFYIDGTLKSEGLYNKGKRSGEWKFYHKNGKLEQIGKYNEEGKCDGIWEWYYDSENLLREESYYNGLEDGYMTEYSEEGEIIAEGEYIEGYEEGFWKYDYGDFREEGTYLNGTRHGLWKYYFNDGILRFEGKFIEDNPNSKHTYYWDNGNKKTEGTYLMGRKEGEWIK